MLRWTDRFVLASSVVVAIVVFLRPFVSPRMLADVPKCLPSSRVLFLAKSDVVLGSATSILRASDSLFFVGFPNESDKVGLYVDRELFGKEFGYSVEEDNSNEALLDLAISSLRFEVDFDVNGSLAGCLACRAISEISMILGLERSNHSAHWRSVYPSLRRAYFDHFESFQSILRVDEIAAILMPLLLPIFVMLLRVLRDKQPTLADAVK